MDILSSLVMNGDISRLTAAQKVSYYQQVCDKLGLDPLSQPFRILRLRGKEILYCDRGGAQQLNKLHKVSHEIKMREVVNGCYVVTAKALTPEGRHTESIGAVPIHNLRGEQLCNAMMKAETKAKRRATLDLLGLGMLDESETEQIVGAEQVDLNINPEVHDEAVTEGGVPESLMLDVAGLKKCVAQCHDEEELLTLYHDNEERIESQPELRVLFTEKKKELRQRMAA